MENGESSYRRFLDGEESAFDEVVKLYLDNLIFFINRYVGDTMSAEDLAIDTLTELVIHPHRYDFKRPLKTYLFAIGKNKAINYLKRHRRVEYTENPDSFADLASLENSVLADERQRAVNRALDRLPDDMRICVHLIYFENLSYKDAASVMKKNVKQIDNLLYRAKNRLRQMLSTENIRLSEPFSDIGNQAKGETMK
ncbi:MAG: RNA polymerase sigma factor [Eubacteriales bacterium]